MGQDSAGGGGSFDCILYFDAPLRSPDPTDLDLTQFTIKDDVGDVMVINSALYVVEDIIDITRFLAVSFNCTPTGVMDPPAEIIYTPGGSSPGINLVGTNGIAVDAFDFTGINGPP